MSKADILEARESTSDALLSVRNLQKYYPVKGGILNRTVGQVQAVDGVDSTSTPVRRSVSSANRGVANRRSAGQSSA
ncbi:hypothetical protein [Halogeometricum sp. CBA1124]|uniref:hypothetical protein n=1 Tax=Halogeometricum sp. CBA1124 TaxID=2668071 RepID=UPI001E590DE8|nr:hypothetical protein [Halogeometricum sp. CBA1124]